MDEWNQVIVEDGEDGGGRTIDQIECTVDEEFSVKITDEEVKLLRDERGEIRYENVHMKKRVLGEGYKPRCYHGGRVITGGHVARFYGATHRLKHG